MSRGDEIERIMAELPAQEADWTHSTRKPAPKRPWKCPDCRVSFSFEWTFKRHTAVHRAGRAPIPVKPGQSSGRLACTACPARYDSEAEMELHHQARHPWMRTA